MNMLHGNKTLKHQRIQRTEPGIFSFIMLKLSNSQNNLLANQKRNAIKLYIDQGHKQINLVNIDYLF